ncbi:Filamin-B [Larimichthys crocea]|uniref:Uncharacterized protein n=1 Tax=Larimichthys crocea TaxID=215358 RepID=A0ACD3RK81_LARCR|nr:Filamin-B [Larimichthys crocea]
MPGACRATGRGLQPVGLRVKQVGDFKVDTKNAGSGDLKVLVKGPKGVEEPVKQISGQDGVFFYEYYPNSPGKYTVSITWGGQNIPKSPFEVVVGREAGPQQIRAWGPGLEGGIVGKPAAFVVESVGTDVGVLGFAIEGPSQAKIECEDQNDGSCDVRYWPTEPGEYAVHVTCDEEDIEHSPFMAHIVPDNNSSDANEVQAYGPGLEKTGCLVNQIAEFTVNAKDAGKGPLKIMAQDAEGLPVEVKVRSKGDGLYACSYTATSPLKHTLAITWGGVSIPNSPYRVNVGKGSHPNLVKVFGPGVERTGLKANEPTHFTVDCSGAGDGDVSVGIKCDANMVGDKEADVDFDIIPNANDTFTVKYMPPAAGRLTVKVLFTDKEVPQSPFHVKVDPSHDASKVKAEGPGLARTGIECGKPTHFTVLTKGAGKAPLDVSFSTPVKDFDIIDNYDYSQTVKYTPAQQGEVTIVVKFGGRSHRQESLQGVEVDQEQQFMVDTKGAGGQGHLEVAVRRGSTLSMCPMMDTPVPGSPFPVEAQLPPDPSKVKAFGPGLKGGLVGNPAEFTIDTKGAGTGGLGLTVEGPTEAKIECSDNGDGTCSVSYLPTEPGDYLVNILFEEVHIPGSPFKADVQMPFDPSKVVASGSGLKRGKVGETSVVNVDCSRAGPGELSLEAALDSPPTSPNWCCTRLCDLHTVDLRHVHTAAEVRRQGRPRFPCKGDGGSCRGHLERSKCSDPEWRDKLFSEKPPQAFTVDARPLTRRGGDHVKAEVKNPSGALTDCLVTDNGDGTYNIEYTPFENGVHSVQVLYDDTPVPKSPFRVSVSEGCDPSRVVATGPGLQQALTDKPNNFDIITRGAGIGGLGITVEGPSESKMSCKDNKDGSCSVEYVPFTPGLYDVNITYGGEHIPGSPFKVPVKDMVDSSKVKVSGPGVGSGVRANIPQSFTVDCRKAGVAPLAVAITAPKGIAEPVEVTDNGDGTHLVSYTPSVEGPYSVAVKYAEEDVPRSPFKFRVLPTHDASKVRASGPGLTNGVPASFPVEFNIDAKDAGQGQLSDQDGKPKQPTIHDNGDGTYRVSYIPDRAGRYTIVIKYGGDDIPASPYKVRATATGDASKCTVTGPGVGPTVAIGEEVGLVVNAKGAGKGKVSCVVVQPDGSEVEAQVLENEDGTFDIFYTAPAPGNYVIYVRFGGENIPRSPFKVMVTSDSYEPISSSVNGSGFRPFDMVIPFAFRKGEITESPLQFYVNHASSPNVTAYGPGLSYGVANKLATFTVFTEDASEGGLDLAIEGPSKAEISCMDNKDGTCSVSYLPTLPGDYNILVKYNDDHIAGSPFTARITQDNQRRSQVKLGSAADFSLNINETDLSLLTASIQSPSGRDEPCLLKRMANNHIGISFIPREVGEHRVSIFKNGRHVANSPITIMVVQSEIGDASQVKAHGDGLVQGTTFNNSSFVVDTREAGYGGLALSIEGPSKVDIQTDDIEDGTCRVTYCPTEPGNYIVSIRFAEEHVPVSWFLLILSRQFLSHTSSRSSYCSLWWSGRSRCRGTRSSAVAQDQSLSPGRVRLISGLSGLVLAAGSRAARGVGGHWSAGGAGLEAIDIQDVTAEVTSPSGVSQPAELVAVGNDTYCVRFVPTEMAEFSIWTREAGAGGLAIAVEGPSRAEISFDDRKDGSCGVSYIAQEPGDYEISVKFNDQHIPDSPYLVPVVAPANDARRLAVTGLQESGLKVNHPASFAVRLNGAQGKMAAKVHSPSGALEECVVTELERDKYAVRFIPRENGVHSIDVKFNGSHIPGSPFQVPSQSSSLTTLRQAPGALAVTIEGPSKVKMDCQEVPEGYKVQYTPMAPGNYLISIKYGGPNHITGSPFKAKVTGSRLVHVTNASETVDLDSGSGSEGVQQQLHPECHVQADRLGRQQGKNMLLVGVHGPQVPCEEVLVKHLGNLQYNVSYLLKERGNYILVVKWGDDHIPGSPFHVVVP